MVTNSFHFWREFDYVVIYPIVFSEVCMQDINPIVNLITDLQGRTFSLRGYL